MKKNEPGAAHMQRAPRLIGCCIRGEERELAAVSGFDFAELPGNMLSAMDEGEFSALRGRMERSGLPCLAVNAALPPEIKICGAGYDAMSAAQYARLLCKRAAALGALSIGIGSPRSRAEVPSFPEELAWDQAAEFMSIFCAEALPYGILVLWESLNSAEASFGISMPEGAKRIVSRLMDGGATNTGLVADVYHMDCCGEDERTLAAVLPYTRHVHIAGSSAFKRGFPDAEFYARHRGVLELLSRDGDIRISMEALEGDVCRDAPAALELARRALG